MTVEIKVRHTRYSSSRAQAVGPNACADANVVVQDTRSPWNGVWLD